MYCDICGKEMFETDSPLEEMVFGVETVVEHAHRDQCECGNYCLMHDVLGKVGEQQLAQIVEYYSHGENVIPALIRASMSEDPYDLLCGIEHAMRDGGIAEIAERRGIRINTENMSLRRVFDVLNRIGLSLTLCETRRPYCDPDSFLP